MQKWIILFCLFFLSACADPSENIHKQFQENGQDTVLDQTTKLMWAAVDNQENCTWQDAKNFCESYTGGGFQDWRMPDSSELSALFKAGIRKNGEMISINGERVWASESEDSKGAFCNFKRPGCGWGEKVMSITMRALPVRDVSPTAATGIAVAAPASNSQSTEQRLQILNALHKQKLITDAEYTQKKATILNEL